LIVFNCIFSQGFKVLIGINQAKEILIHGGVVGIPTETVYGLGGWIHSPAGIAKIFEVKERPFFDPLIVHVDTIEKAKSLSSDWTPIHDILAEHCWPGPLTLITKKINSLNPMITSGLDSVGIRCPNHPLTLSLLKSMDGGIAAPSANKFGKTSPTLATHVEDEFEGTVPTLDGGPCEIGIESTVVGIEKTAGIYSIKIFRPGFFTSKALKEILNQHGYDLEISYHKSPVAPGQLEHHYMPSIPLIIVPQDFDWEKHKNKIPLNLKSPAFWHQPENPAIASRELYAKMREFDQEKFDGIICFKNQGSLEEDWLGIWNRLEKAKTFKVD